MIPYGRQTIEEDDIQAVVEILKSDWLTTGPKVQEFERVFADLVGAREAVAVSSGTAALHAAMFAIGISTGDEVVVSPMTFAASVNCVVYQGGTPVFADVDPDTLLIDPIEVTREVTPRTKAIIAVDYAGQPCDYDALRAIANQYNLVLVADACHSLGGSYRGCLVGSLADLNVFSFHPVKHITTGEGGMITTDSSHWAQQMRIFRNHGITKNHRQRDSWFYEMVTLGYNYRLTDLQCALGISQLSKLRDWVTRRQEIAQRYDEAFAKIPEIEPLVVRKDVSHAYHLYVVRINSRDKVFAALRAKGIGVNVHYIPVYLHPFYRKRFATKSGRCPLAEAAYKQIISLPMFPSLTNIEVNKVIEVIQ